MTIGGWITMVVSIGLVTGLFIWCVYKVLSIPGETEHMHGFDVGPEEEFFKGKGKSK